MREHEAEGKIKASELRGKTIVNFYDGVGMCHIQEVDFAFDTDSGRMEAIIIAQKRSGFLAKKKPLKIPWEVIRKIGKEVIIVDMSKII